MNKTATSALCLSVFVFICLFTVNDILAQNTEEKAVATNYTFDNGSIVTSEEGTIRGNLNLSQASYDNRIVGVFISDGTQSSNVNRKRIPVKNEGVCNVKFNSENGPIRKGDPVTSSSTPGVAMKATQSGIILGIAVEDAIGSNGTLKVRVLIQYLKQ